MNDNSIDELKRKHEADSSRLDEMAVRVNACKTMDELNKIEKEASSLKLEYNASRQALTDAYEKAIGQNQNTEERRAFLDDIANGRVESTLMRSFSQDGGLNNKEQRNMENTDNNIKEFRKFIHEGIVPASMETRGIITTGAAAVIPETIYNKMLVSGTVSNDVLSKVTISKFLNRGKIKIPVMAAGSAIWHVEEHVELGDTPALTSIELAGYELFKLVSVSAATEALSDASFTDYLSTRLFEEVGATLSSAIINGTGVDQPTGIIPGGTWVLNSNMIQWGLNDDIDIDDIISGIALLKTKYKQNACFIGNRDMVYNQIRKQRDADGRFLLDVAADGLSILGIPVVVNEDVPANTLILGDLRNYFINFSQDILIERSRESGFSKATIDFRALAVVDGKPFTEAFVLITKAV